VWRDDRTIVYSRVGPQGRTIVIRPADGSGAETVLSLGLSPDVKKERLAFTRLQAGTGADLYHLLLPASGSAAREEMLQQLPEHEIEPAFSPDGTLLAYTQGNAGESNVVLRTYPERTAQWQVSAHGGTLPAWSPRGDAIYYR
jgi:Tol biopolymer transport system component